MNTSAATRPRPLVVGFGNSLRGDDAIGSFVAELLAGDPRLQDAVVLAVHQLTPELADDVARAGRLVIVDASASLTPGAIETVEISGVEGPVGGGSAMTHHLDVSTLLGLARRLYGSAPRTTVISVGIGSTEPADGFSHAVAEAIPRVVEAVAQLCREPSHA